MADGQTPDNRALVDRLDALEKQLQLAQDRWDLFQIIATYGPAVDSGSNIATGDLWDVDGIYDVSPTYQLTGRSEIADMVLGEGHQGWITNGAAHLQGIPHIAIDGDTAVVTHYSQLVLKNADEDSFRVWRTGVNVWHFVRTEQGWKATNRINRQLDGSAEARELLAQAVADVQGQS